MDRALDPVYEALRDALEAELDALGFRLASERHDYAAFGSAEAEYRRRGARVRLTWDGKDRWAWAVHAAQPTAAYPLPSSYRNLDAEHEDGTRMSPRLATAEQGVSRARELVDRLRARLAAATPRDSAG